MRRLVYALRPPALDGLGVVGAVGQLVERQVTPSVRVTLMLPDEPPAFPAAVEVAVLRVTQEALNNVVTHANARHCTVQLMVEDAVTLVITDDGGGLPSGYRSGVGLVSMRERAEELGGTLRVSPEEGGGTRVTAVFPRRALEGADR